MDKLEFDFHIAFADGYGTYLVKFLRACRQSYEPGGKHWPKVTQCLILHNGIVCGMGEVVKDSRDADNPVIAARLAAKKAIAMAGFWRHSPFRKVFWEWMDKQYPVARKS